VICAKPFTRLIALSFSEHLNLNFIALHQCYTHVRHKMQPFKPPTLVGKPAANITQPSATSEPPLKKRRISRDAEHDVEVVNAAANVLKKPKPPKAFQTPYAARKPLQNVSNPAATVSPESRTDSYYTVLW